jgi:hypothetical protein
MPAPPSVVAFVPVWGNARSGRGISNLDKAQAFARDYPPGSELTREAFCNWAAGQGYLSAPPSQSNQPLWLQHQHRTADLLKKIRTSARSPVMQGSPSGPYRIDGKRMLKVVALDEMHLINPEATRPIETMTRHVHQQLKHEFQSADWAQFSPATRYQAEEMYREHEYWEEDLKVQRKRQYERLERTRRVIEQERNARQMQLALAAPENDDGLGIDASTMDDLGL